MWLKSRQNISLKLKLYFYKLRQPQQIAVVILINQLASVDQSVQKFKGVSLNSGLYPFRKLSSLFFALTFLPLGINVFKKLYILASVAAAFKYETPLNMWCSYPAHLRGTCLIGFNYYCLWSSLKRSKKGSVANADPHGFLHTLCALSPVHACTQTHTDTHTRTHTHEPTHPSAQERSLPHTYNPTNREATNS